MGLRVFALCLCPRPKKPRCFYGVICLPVADCSCGVPERRPPHRLWACFGREGNAHSSGSLRLNGIKGTFFLYWVQNGSTGGSGNDRPALCPLRAPRAGSTALGGAHGAALRGRRPPPPYGRPPHSAPRGNCGRRFGVLCSGFRLVLSRTFWSLSVTGFSAKLSPITLFKRRAALSNRPGVVFIWMKN